MRDFLKPMRKKIIACILLFLFLFNTMGYYFIFELNKFFVRKEMQRITLQMPLSYTRLVVQGGVNNPDLVRIHRNEISYKSRLYDIAREEQFGPSIIFYCIPDTKEESLSAEFKRVNNNRYCLALQDHLIKIALLKPHLVLDQPKVAIIKYMPYKITSYSWFLSIWSPPPNVA